MQNRLLKVAFFITFTELIMGLIVGAYFKLSYFLAPPKEPSMGVLGTECSFLCYLYLLVT